VLATLSRFRSLPLAILLVPGCRPPSPPGAAPIATPAAPDAGAGVTAEIPDTPAGRLLSEWLQAVNSGRREDVHRYVTARFEPPRGGTLPVDAITDAEHGLYRSTRGLDIREIVASSADSISALAQARWTGVWLKVDLYVTAEAPHKIVGFGRGGVEAPAGLLPRVALDEREVVARTDALLDRLVEVDQFSGTVTIARHGEPFYRRASGLASRSWQVPNRTDTRFNLASITKMFTAVAVAQLVEQGKLAYTDTIGTILPGYPNQAVAREVTVHHLLSHTSGMIGARALAEKRREPATARTVSEMVAPFVDEPLGSPPGQRFDYSNAGFILLGAIIEEASGRTYFDYMRERVFAPAGMRNTDFYALDTDPRNLAAGLADGPNKTRRNNIFDLGVIGSPAGGAYSTGEDMARFQRALVQHTLLGAAALETLWTAVGDHDYAYGAHVTRYNGARIVWHGGGWKGITDHFDMYPELGYTVVVLCNIDNDPAAIAFKLREWLTQGR
jgi:CubicO group peptidase (beta-lactamase class C family)